MKILAGKKVADSIYEGIKNDLANFRASNLVPKIVVALVGDDPASLSYIGVKRARAQELGIDFDFHHFDENIDQGELCKKIVDLNRIPGACGIIIQLPLPEKFDHQQVLDCVLPSLDIDGLTSANQTRLVSGNQAFVSPTPASILAILEFYKINLADKHVVIVGAGELVGKPLSKILMQKGITFSVATQETKNLSDLTKQADVLISAVGKAGLIDAHMVKKGVTLIDAGTSFISKHNKFILCGDADYESVAKKAGWLTPVPGGVGPVTVAMLYKNLMESCKRLKG